jgi:hypothetical protein
MMERMLREQHQGGSGLIGNGGNSNGSGNGDSESRRSAFFAREQIQASSFNLGSGADRLLNREGLGACGPGSRQGGDIERQQLQMFAERHAMQDRQALQDRMAFFGGVGGGSVGAPGSNSFNMGNGTAGMYLSQGLDRPTSELMTREEEAAARLRVERRLIQEATMREHQGLNSLGGSGALRFGGGNNL